jgi:outer membrane receptor protein involved in Fe transport
LSGTCASTTAAGSATPAVETDFTHFDPEFSKSYELGVKSMFFDGRARLNVTAFWTDFEDFQLNTFTGLGFIVSNAKSARSRGGELEAFVEFWEGLTANLGVTYADARYGRDVDIAFTLVNSFVPTANPPDEGTANGLPCSCFIDHRRLTNAPAWTGSAAVNFEHKLFASEWVGFASVNTAYRGRHNTGSNLHPFKFEKAHWFVNLVGGVRSPDGHWEASLWSTNLTDTFDRSIIFDTPAQSGTFHAFAGPPRMWGGTLRYTF